MTVLAEPGAAGSRLRARAQWAARTYRIALYAMPAFVLVFVIGFRSDLVAGRAIAWLCTVAIGVAVGLGAAVRFLRSNQRSVGVFLVVTTMASAAIGAAWGAIPLVVGDVEQRSLTWLFPIGALTMSLIVHAAFWRSFVATITATLTTSLISIAATDIESGFGLGLAFVGYGVLLVGLFGIINRAVVALTDAEDRNARLTNRLQQSSAEIQQASDLLDDATQRLGQQESYDHLTGLLSRSGIVERLGRELRLASARSGQVVVLMVNLDRFQVFNSSLGRDVGDEMLLATGRKLSAAFPKSAHIARLGADNFVVVLPTAPSVDSQREVARAIDIFHVAITTPVRVGGRDRTVSGGIGVAVGPDHGDTPDELLRYAEAAVQEAKSGGPNQRAMFEAGNRQRGTANIDDEQEVRRALTDGEFEPWYQPIIDATTGSFVGAEMLTRWRAADGVVRTAGSFMPAVVATGLSQRLSEQVFEQAFSDLAGWDVPAAFRLGINLPERFFMPTHDTSWLLRRLRHAPCHHLTVEMTESSVVDDLVLAIQRMNELKELGVHIALDDFGTGAASLTLVQDVPADVIKIDRSFVTGVAQGVRGSALVRAIVSLTTDLGMDATAEGVERAEQAQALIELGCTLHQGYLYGRPAPAHQFAAALAASRSDR